MCRFWVIFFDDTTLIQGRVRAGKMKGNGLWDPLMACVRLLSANALRKYTDVPLQSLLLMTAAITYFLIPFDLIPDFIVGLTIGFDMKCGI